MMDDMIPLPYSVTSIRLTKISTKRLFLILWTGYIVNNTIFNHNNYYGANFI